MDLASLPQDILLLILSYLEAHDLLHCQCVSRKWRSSLTDDIYMRTVLKFYSDAREVRSLLTQDPNALHFSSSFPSRKVLLHAFRTISRRYFHLNQGKVHKISRHPLQALDQSGHWHPTPQWDYHESQPGGRLYHESANHVVSANRKPYLFRQSLWSYDDGLVAYAPRDLSALRELNRATEAAWDSSEPWKGTSIDTARRQKSQHVLAVLDVESEEVASVPFDIAGRVIRNLRLKQGTLIVEWAERHPFHDLNLVDKVHRHFATVFDVGRQHHPRTVENDNENKMQTKLKVTFRSEFKIHFLGLPLTARDHFFSTHTQNYYALYLWQPNRSLWTGDEDQPIEALFIWDIRSPSTYRPSEDPANSRRAEHSHAGPSMFGRFSFRELEFLGIRQRANIALINLAIEELEEGGNVVWKENVFMSGQGYFDPAERNWRSRITRFPFNGEGAAQVLIGEEELVAYRGGVSMESCELEEDEVEKWFLPVMDVVDREAGVRFALLETCFSGMGMINRIEIRVKVVNEGRWENMDRAVVDELGLMGRIAGDERWIVGMNRRLEIVIARFQ